MINQRIGGSRKFESHASWMTNNRIGLLFAQVDLLGPRAWSSMRLADIQAYFHTVNQIFKNVKDVLQNSDEVMTFKNKYDYLVELVNTDERFRSMRSLQALLKLTDEMYSLIVTGMQSWEYFFRVGTYQKKGLKNIRFFEDSIFSGGGLNNGNNWDGKGDTKTEEDSS